jgi:hypothetical protein
MAFEASIVVQFGEEVSDDALAILELDDEKNVIVNEQGEQEILTQFEPGYKPHFLFHYDNDLIIKEISFSSGNVVRTSTTLHPNNLAFAGGLIRNRTQRLQFMRETINSEKMYADLTYKLRYPYADAVEKKWYKDPNLSTTVIETGWTIDGRKVSLPSITQIGKKVKVMDFTYKVHFEQYRLDPPPMTLGEDESFPVLVVFYLENRE